MKIILLVDDSPTILASMSGILRKNGYKIETAPNGEDAVTKINAGLNPSLIITDYNMPGMNGVEVIRQSRKVASCRFIPMLILTTESQQQKRDEAKAAGATGWLVKPVPADQLLGVVGQIIP
ncbi:MAG: response regulator [Robiginitomaculum sp.]|nr:response regulator [Robiginitomaculum sp.]